MAHRVEVGPKPHLFDARGERIKRQIRHAFPKIDLDGICCLDIYTIDSPDINPQWCAEAFCDPVIQDIAIDRPLKSDYDWYIEVGYKPGVTDNVGHSAQYALGLISARYLPVYSARAYLIKADIHRKTAEAIARECLANTLIQNCRVFDPAEAAVMAPYVPKVVDLTPPSYEEMDLNCSDDELISLSQTRTLALNLTELKAVQAYMNDPGVQSRRAQMGPQVC